MTFAAQLLRMTVRPAVIVAALFNTASADIPPAPLGLDRDGTAYALLTNSTWKVSENGSGFVPAKAVIPLASGNPAATSAFDRQERAYIWAKRCTDSQQVLVFRQTYYLPGPPKTFGVAIEDSTWQTAPSDRAISKTTLIINGATAFSVNGGRATVDLGKRYAKLFKSGQNTVEVRVVKRARQGTSIGQCRHGSPERPLGINFNFYGDFEADLWLSKDRNANPVIYVRQDPAALGLQIAIRPENRGPSAIYKGALTINFSSINALSVLQPQSLRTTGRGIRGCEVTVPNPLRIDCELFKMRPGDEPVVKFLLIVDLAPGYSQVQVSGGATITSPTRDVKFQTNGWNRTRIFCGPAATDPKCPPP